MNRVMKLTDEQRKAIKEEIHAYYLDERGEDIGIILQEGLLDLFLEQQESQNIQHQQLC